MRRTLEIMLFCISRSIRHPRTTIQLIGNPIVIPPQPPVPWLVSIFIAIVGITSLCLGEVYDIGALGETGRAMVYIPLTYMYGKSSGIASASKDERKKK